MLESSDDAPLPRYAGFWVRALASVIDELITLAVQILVLVPLFGWNFFQTGNWGQLIATRLMFWLFPALYFVLFWIFYSATPGKMMLRLRVINGKTGAELTAREAVVRYLGYFLSTMAIGLGYVWIAFDHKKRGWHDLLADTEVVQDPPTVRWSAGRKIAVAVVVLMGLGLGATLAGKLAMHSFRTWAEKAKDGPGRKAGLDYAKTHSQIECVNAGIAGARAASGFGEIIQNSLFVRTCLEAATPSKQLCVGVPKHSQFKETLKWRLGLQQSLQCAGPGCDGIFQQVQNFCEKKEAPRNSTGS